MATQAGNDFWGTISSLGEKLIDAKLRTQSAPQGSPSQYGGNPWFGDWGVFPQAETKPQPGQTTILSRAFLPILLALGGFVLLALFIKR